MVLACCAFFSWSLATACCCFCRSSERTGRAPSWARALPRQTAPTRRAGQKRRISMESDQILHHAAEAPADVEISHEHELLIELEPSRGLLLAGARIGLADVDIEP